MLFRSTAGGEAVAHAWQSDRVGFEMTSGAFAAAFPFEVGSIPIGTLVASIALLLFVFTTLLTWSYYGERAITFLYDRMKGSTREGEKKLHMVWRVLWCVVIFIGAAQPSELVWRLGDISNATMVLPNLLALALLSGVVFKLARGDRTAGKEFHEATREEPEAASCALYLKAQGPESITLSGPFPLAVEGWISSGRRGARKSPVSPSAGSCHAYGSAANCRYRVWAAPTDRDGCCGKTCSTWVTSMNVSAAG